MQITGRIAPPEERMDLLVIGDPLLERESEPISKFEADLGQLLDAMAATMYHNRGVGLAAVQVGVPRRVIVVDYDEGLRELVNPEIISERGSKKAYEGCLSVPGYLGEVTRPTEVRVQARDRRGRKIWLDAEGWAARVLRHEIDHLGGMLFPDRSSSLVKLGPETRLRLVFMGSPEFAVPSLGALVEHNCQVVGVATAPDRPRGRGQKTRPTPVKERALDARIPVIEPESADDDQQLVQLLRCLEPDLIVVSAYGRLLAKDILDIPNLFCINIHPSLLPRYRGAAPIQRQILAGEMESGVSIFCMDEGMDSGPVLKQHRMQVKDEDDAGVLHDALAELGAELLIETLKDIAAGEAEPVEQDHCSATYAPKIDRDELQIDWSLPADRVVNTVRAFSPRPGAWTWWRGRRMKVLKAELTDDAGGQPGRVHRVCADGISVAAGEGACRLKRIQLPGGRPMEIMDFVNGYDMGVGEILGVQETQG